jgi:hypothetical protein
LLVAQPADQIRDKKVGSGSKERFLETASVQAATERDVMHGAVGVATPKFDPGVAQTVFVLVHEEVPLNSFGGISVGLHAMRSHFAIEQEGELQCQHTRLSSTVIAPQQEPPLLKQKLLLIVFEDVQHSASQRLPPFARGAREHTFRGISGSCLPEQLTAHKIDPWFVGSGIFSSRNP